jgi:hypothetical protein
MSRSAVIADSSWCAGLSIVRGSAGIAARRARKADSLQVDNMRYGSLYPKRVLYPVAKIPRARRRIMDKAVDAVVAKMKPRSLQIGKP